MAVAIASIIGGAEANALPFTSSPGAAKALCGDGGLMEEAKRHNAALEQLQKAQAQYNKKRADAIDKRNARLVAEGATTRRLDDDVEASQLYKEVMSYKGRQLDDSLLNISAPILSDYYMPSDDQKIREYMFVAGGGFAGTVIGYWYHLRHVDS